MALTDKLNAIADAVRYKTGLTGSLSLDEMIDAINAIDTGFEPGTAYREEETGYGITAKLTALGNAVRAKTGYDGKMSLEVMATAIRNMEILAYNDPRRLKYIRRTSPDAYEVAGIGTYNDSRLVIPSTYNGLPVTSVSPGAFMSCGIFNSVAISEGVTSLGNGAFHGCTNLLEVALPSSLTTISAHAFSVCGNLQTINLPRNLSSIGDYAFAYCARLTNVFLPSSLSSMGVAAFVDCSSLTSMIIPQYITSIGAETFSGCTSLASLEFEYVYTRDKITIGNYAFKGNAFTDILFPAGTEIGSYAFKDSAVQTIEVLGRKDCGTIIKEAALDCAYAVTDLIIGDGWSTINTLLTSDSNTLPLARVYLGSTKSGIIGEKAFSKYDRLTHLETITIGDCYDLQLGYRSFGGMYNIVSAPGCSEIRISAAGSQAFCYGVVRIPHVHITKTIKSSQAFYNSDFLGVTIDASQTYSYLFEGSSIQFCLVTSGIYYSLHKTASIEDLILEGTYSGQSGDGYGGVIAGGTPITNLYINASAENWKDLEEGIREGDEPCSGVLSNIYVTWAQSEIAYAPWGSATAKVTYNYKRPTGVPVSVDENNTLKLRIVGKPDYDLGTAYIKHADLPYSTTSENVTDPYYFYVPSEFMGHEIVELSNMWNVNNLEFPATSTVTTIGANCFKNCQGVDRIILPRSLVNIPENIFSGLDYLKEICVPWGRGEVPGEPWGADINKITFNSVATPGLRYEKDYYGVHLVGVNKDFVPDGAIHVASTYRGEPVTRIRSYVFEYFDAGKNDIYVPDSVKTMGPAIFKDAKIGQVFLPDTITELDYDMFKNSTVTYVKLPSKLTTIDSGAFEGCISLKSIKLPVGLLELGARAFTDCTSLESIELPTQLTIIQTNTFSGCTKLQSIGQLPRGLTRIDDRAFTGCKMLQSIGSLPSGLTRIGNFAFSNCEKAFSGEVILPNGLTTIGGGAFSNCEGITSITIPATVTSFVSPNSALFYSISTLEKAYILTTADNVINGFNHEVIKHFDSCTNLTDIYVAWSKDRPGYNAAPWGATNATVHYDYTA